MRKLRIALAIAACVLALVVTTAFFVEFEVPGLGRRILEAAGDNAGIRLQASRFRLHLRHGIVLEDVVATTDIASGTVVTTVDSVVLEHRLLPLLLGDIVVDRLLMERPVIEVRNVARDTASAHPQAQPRRTALRRPAAPQAAAQRLGARRAALRRVAMGAAQETGSRSGWGREMAVHAASVTDGTLRVLAPDGEETTRVTGLDAELEDINVDARARAVAVGLSARGHIDVGTVHWADRVASGSRANITAADGIFTVTGLQLDAPEGKLRLEELVVDVNPVPYTYRTALSGQDLDLNRLLGLETAGTLGGAQFEMQAAGAGPQTSSVEGGGRLALAAGAIPDLPALDRVVELIGLDLAGSRYQATTIDFTVADERVDVAPFEIVSELMRLQAAGKLGADGALDGRANVFVPRQEIDLGRWQGDLSDALVDALTDESGWVSIPVIISGTVAEPRVSLDTVALLEALRQGGGLEGWMQGIIKRDEDSEDEGT